MRTSFRLDSWFLGLWALGVIALSARYLRDSRRLGGIIDRSTCPPGDVIAAWDAFATPPEVQIRTSSEVHSPCLARAWRPVLLLPDRPCPDLDREELRAILAHEMAHARGRDLAWNHSLHLVAIVLWFHPLAWRIRQAHASACDGVCDAMAADQLGDVASYSRSLARLALRAAGTTPAGGLAMARVSDVRRRIESLHGRVFRSSLPRRFTVPATLAFGLCVVMIGGLGFTRPGQGSSAAGPGSPPASIHVVHEGQVKAPPAPASGPQGLGGPAKRSATLSASGTVVDAVGKPIAGATLILREWAILRVIGMGPKELEDFERRGQLSDTLAEVKTDGEGRFRFENISAPEFPGAAEAGRTVFPWDIVALAPGRGLAWIQLTSYSQRRPVSLTLDDEGTLHGRIVEPGGHPVRGVKVRVSGIDPLGRPVDNIQRTDNRLNLYGSAFPLGAKTDADGRFTIRGLPRNRVITLEVTDPGHEALIAYAATTDVAQPDNVGWIRRSHKAEEIRNPVHTGAFTLTAKRSDHVLTGRIVYEADRKPAAGARLMYGRGAKNIWKDVKAAQDGWYRIEGLASGPLEIHAIAEGSESAPLDASLEIPEERKLIERDLVLPLALVIAGRVVDGATGLGVGKSMVDFVPTPGDGRTPTLFGFRKEADAAGRFRLAVPPGRGTLLLWSVPQEFPHPVRKDIGEDSDPQFSRDVQGLGGQTVEVADFRLSRSGGVVVRAIDPSGRPVANATVKLRGLNRAPRDEPGKTDGQGRYEPLGVQPGQVTVIDITADASSLGATLELEPRPAGGNPKELDVRLQPLASLSGRVLDEGGRPIVGSTLQLYRSVAYPGQDGRWFGLPLDTRNEKGDDGSYTFDRLIAGATYYTHVEVDGHAAASSKFVTPFPGKPVRLDDFRLPLAGQEFGGVVVDPLGKPLGGVFVGFDQGNERASNLSAPPGFAWSQTTDDSGRFHLTGLPRGPVRLMAYRRVADGDRAVRGMTFVEMRPGQGEIRIELRDPNDRLRGND